MAITINGSGPVSGVTTLGMTSGTITGISQGGLNDNIITKNEMATGGAWAPAGTVLQVVNSYDAATSSSSSTYANVFASDLSITLSSTSNKIVLIVTSPYTTSSNSGGTADLGAFMNIVRTTSGSTQLLEQRIRAASITDIGAPMVLMYVDSGFAALTQTYNVQFKRYGGNDAASTQYTQFVAMEVAV